MNNIQNIFPENINMILKKISQIIHLDNIDWSNLTSTIITTLAIIILSTIFLWLIRAIGLYKMAKSKGNKLAFISFIPYFCLYIEGIIVGPTKIAGIEIEKTEFLLPFIALSTMFPYTKGLSIVLLIFFYYCILYKIYQSRTPNFAIIFLILSIIFPILQPFFIFSIRNKEVQSI
ncbi:MAG: hypothetical protein RSE00_02155 [Clostridia bacterium]